jgi:hypothetical protein
MRKLVDSFRLLTAPFNPAPAAEKCGTDAEHPVFIEFVL